MTTGNRPIQTDQAPAAIGPYSQAVVAGDLVFCSGQIALDPSSMTLVGDGDVAAETEQVMKNLGGLLEASGSSFAEVVRTTIFLTTMDDFGTVNEVYAKYFDSASLPARACVAVKELPKGVSVEIDCIARVS